MSPPRSERKTAELGFDVAAFIRDFVAVVKKRGLSIERACWDIGIDHASMSRYRSLGAYPKAPQLAAMARWSGLDVGEYLLLEGVRLGRAS